MISKALKSIFEIAKMRKVRGLSYLGRHADGLSLDAERSGRLGGHHHDLPRRVQQALVVKVMF